LNNNQKLKGKWRHTWINNKTGVISTEVDGDKSWIEGYLFEIVNSDVRETPEIIQDGHRRVAKTLKALPNTCAECGADYKDKKYLASPIRGFRTGFAKITRSLIKETFSQLSKSSRKTIVFSDSKRSSS